MTRTSKYRVRREELERERKKLRTILTDVLCDVDVPDALDNLMGNPMELVDSWFGTKKVGPYEIEVKNE